MTKHTYEAHPASLQTCNVQNLIKTLRKINKITQEELASRLDVTQQEISKLEQPKANLTINVLSNVCTQLQTFPLITFASNHTTAILDPQLIDCFNNLKKLSPEKQALIYELIRLLS